MNDPKVELARQVWTLLTASAEGYDRDALAKALATSDREMREAVELCAKLSSEAKAENSLPWVIGYDPMTGRYHAANSPEQAARIMTYAFSYVRSGLERVRGYVNAYKARWGEAEVPSAVQQGLFDAGQVETDLRRYSR
jgi:hypothetical protein